MNLASRKQVLAIVIVAALGYFVDIYDLILFGIVRKASLLAIGLPADQIHDKGVFLINMQMIGMVVGGIIWGILGDKKGRLATLFFTILLYSLANIANGFVQNLEQYAVLRVIAGIGLAGELGVGITMVSEVMNKETRGLGTTIVSGVGIVGASLAFLIAHYVGWRQAYWAGGVLGIMLLITRISVYESSMFQNLKHQGVERGSFFKLFTNAKRFVKYIQCIFIGIPVWYVIGILVLLSPEFAANVFHVHGEIDGGRALMYHYIGAALGCFITGLMSQWLHSRKKALLYSLILLCISVAIYFLSYNVSSTFFYLVIFLLGIAQGYWAVFITIASEQFGTNMRATVATTVPNFVRGSTFLMLNAYEWIGSAQKGSFSGALVIGIVVLILAFIALYNMEETYGKELDYIEPL